MEIMNTYGFNVDLPKYILRVGQEKLKFSMAEMIRLMNHSIMQVTVAKKEVNRCGGEEPLVLHVEMEEELVGEVPTYMMTKEVIGKHGHQGKALDCS